MCFRAAEGIRRAHSACWAAPGDSAAPWRVWQGRSLPIENCSRQRSDHDGDHPAARGLRRKKRNSSGERGAGAPEWKEAQGGTPHRGAPEIHGGASDDHGEVASWGHAGSRFGIVFALAAPFPNAKGGVPAAGCAGAEMSIRKPEHPVAVWSEMGEIITGLFRAASSPRVGLLFPSVEEEIKGNEADSSRLRALHRLARAFLSGATWKGGVFSPARWT